MKFARLPLSRGSVFRAPAPLPRPTAAGPFSLIRALWTNPIEAWTREHFERFIVVHRLPFGEVVVASHPAAVRRVLADNAANYPKDRFQKRMLAVLSNGLLTAEDPQWQLQRRAMAPVFTLKNVRCFAPGMVQLIDALVARWRSRDGEVIDVAAAMSGLALDVLERTIFSGGIAGNDRALRGAMRIYFDSLGRIDPFDFLELPDFVPRLTRLRARPAIRLFHRAVDDNMIASRRRQFDARPAGMPHDILALLLRTRDAQTGGGLSEPEIRANVITFMAAGHESTANAITWALFLLSRSAEWRQRVLAEAERECGGAPPAESLPDRLVETRAVVEEALRLYPPLTAISRVALANDELAGTRINGGAMVVIASYVLRRHSMWWNAPDVFDPARFLPRAHGGIDRYVYLPFGAGPRGCIGSVFALQEATLAVAAITRSFDLDVAPDEVWPVHRITLRPRGGLPMVLRRCLPSLAALPRTAAMERRALAGH
jgi:cytochrome P450